MRIRDLFSILPFSFAAAAALSDAADVRIDPASPPVLVPAGGDSVGDLRDSGLRPAVRPPGGRAGAPLQRGAGGCDNPRRHLREHGVRDRGGHPDRPADRALLGGDPGADGHAPRAADLDGLGQRPRLLQLDGGARFAGGWAPVREGGKPARRIQPARRKHAGGAGGNRPRRGRPRGGVAGGRQFRALRSRRGSGLRRSPLLPLRGPGPAPGGDRSKRISSPATSTRFSVFRISMPPLSTPSSGTTSKPASSP